MMEMILLLVLLLNFVASALSAPSSFISSAFIKSASPIIVSNTPAPSATVTARTHAIASGYGMLYKGRKIDPLFAKKKTVVAKGGKIQVKLLKYVEGTGKIGDIVMVAPAYYENSLKKTKSAVIISEDKIQKQNAEQRIREAEQLATAKELRDKVEKISLVVSKKSGPDGHLFGAIGIKTLIEELGKQFPKGVLDGKQTKILSVKGKDGKELDHDVKYLGEYSVTISLLKDVAANFTLNVVSEK